MKLGKLMTRQVEVVPPSASLRQAAQMMRDYDVGPVPVVENGRVVGILTDRDIAVRAVAEGRDAEETTVAEVMTRHVDCCQEDEDVEKAAKLMSDKQIRRLVVLDEQRRLAGIVSLGDLALAVHSPAIVSAVLEDVSKPGHATR